MNMTCLFPVTVPWPDSRCDDNDSGGWVRKHTFPEIMSSGRGVLAGISGEWCDGKNIGLQSSGLGDDLPCAHLYNGKHSKNYEDNPLRLES